MLLFPKIDYDEPPLLDVMASLNADRENIRHIANIVTAYKKSLGRQIGSRTLPETCTLAMYGEEPEEKIYLRNTTIEISNRYDPTPPIEILPAINDMAMFISKYNDMDILAKAALAHYQVEAIHPFDYYNGVVGRIMISMILHNAGHEAAAFLSLSQYLYFHTNDYFDLLSRTQYSGGYLVWVKFFVKGVCTSAKHAIEQITKMQQIISEDEAKIKSSQASTKSTWLVYNYFKQNLVSMLRPATDSLGIAYNSVLKAVQLLSALEVLFPVNEQGRNRSFVYIRLKELYASKRC